MKWYSDILTAEGILILLTVPLAGMFVVALISALGVGVTLSYIIGAVVALVVLAYWIRFFVKARTGR